MANKYDVEYTDTYAGEANYSWVKRAIVTMPELTHYGYDGGTNYSKANRVYERELMKRAKAEMGLTGMRGTVERYAACYGNAASHYIGKPGAWLATVDVER